MVLSCTVLKEAGELEKIGTPVAVDGVETPAANTAPPAQTANPYVQQYQQPAPIQQRPSQYDLSLHD
jgi:hypothetical protein